MIKDAIGRGRLLAGMTKNLSLFYISMLSYTNLETSGWLSCLIWLIKYFERKLKSKVQTVLGETISSNQCAFLPLWYIFDNVLLTHEALAWAKQSGHDVVFLNLDFAKAYNIVEC